MENNLPKRKHPRLDNYDYSSCGAYFITICAHNREPILSEIVISNSSSLGYDVRLKPCGIIAEEQLLALNKRYPFLTLDEYVIMPDHIHAILIWGRDTAGASPRPTVMDVICAYKSLTTKECKKNVHTNKIFQTSFYEHIIRNRDDYEEIRKYIHENPLRWYYREKETKI